MTLPGSAVARHLLNWPKPASVSTCRQRHGLDRRFGEASGETGWTVFQPRRFHSLMPPLT